jgi:putative alpha-1,2-mannosidase
MKTVSIRRSTRENRKQFQKWIHFEKRQSVAITLGHSYDDWALAHMARELGKENDYEYFIPKSLNYKNLYRPDKALFWPKDHAMATGSTSTPNLMAGLVVVIITMRTMATLMPGRCSTMYRA